MIGVLSVHIPPLRERKEDIPLLADHFIKGCHAFKSRSFSEAAIQAFSRYHWPGNVREVQNIVHRTLPISQRPVIGPADLPLDIAVDRKTGCYRREDVEREHILKVLLESGGQRGRAAELPGISPKTLYTKLTNYGVAS